MSRRRIRVVREAFPGNNGPTVEKVVAHRGTVSTPISMHKNGETFLLVPISHAGTGTSEESRRQVCGTELARKLPLSSGTKPLRGEVFVRFSSSESVGLYANVGSFRRAALA